MVETSARAVLAAMAQCEKLGTAAFLKAHGRRAPKEFWVLHPKTMKRYPAKAIAAVALGWNDIGGGYSKANTACNVLERAGFEIVSVDGQRLTFDERVTAISDGLGATERDALVKQRVGQDLFRADLLRYWRGRCAITGIEDVNLLRASHIMPWARFPKERRSVFNGLLLFAGWDAAFDVGLVSFADNGAPLFSSKLSKDAEKILRASFTVKIKTEDAHAPALKWHRGHYGF